MTKNKPTDLISIANSELAQKLNEEAERQEKKQASDDSLEQAPHQSFKQDIWHAVFILNIFRYALALILLSMSVLHEMNSELFKLYKMHEPSLFVGGAATLLISAITFTYITKFRKFALSPILLSQFLVDVALAGVLTHATGSISSSLTILFFIVVTTGSVVLRRKHSLALASGAFIILVYEHFYSILEQGNAIEARYDLLAVYGFFLLFSGLLISYLARRLKEAELKSFVPGNETIEQFLVREEINALKSALLSTEGNKTEAAKLLGMTFRSFRYKLTKYGVD